MDSDERHIHVMMGEGAKVSQDPSREAFPGATGRGVRVTVIDSGVNPKHPHIQGVAGGIAIGMESGINSYVDFLGHGTAVLAAIQEKAPDAEFYAIKIYYRSLRTDINLLITALHWAIGEGADVINLSLGTLNTSYCDRLIPIVKRANDAGILLVAAAEIDSLPSLPGSLPGVIGVGLDWTCPRNSFRKNPSEHGPHWLASGYPRSLPGVAPSDNLRGISFSVANMSGIVARACEKTKQRSPSGICKALHSEAERLISIEDQVGER
jgi:subtilisin family serine protease